MYSDNPNPKYIQKYQELIACHTPKVREVLSDGIPRRFAQIMNDCKLNKSVAIHVLGSMEEAGEVRKFQAKDPTANYASRVTWFELSRREV